MERKKSGQRSARPAGYGGRSSYDGRFGTSADAGSRRPTGSYRSQPSGSYRSRMDYEEKRGAAQRPSVRSGGDSYTRRPSPEDVRQTRERRAARKKKRRRTAGVIAAVVAAAAVVLVLILLLGGSGGTVHQLPTVERIASAVTEAL